MNILLDIPKLSKTQGGVYQYSLALLNILATGNLPHDFFIFCHKPDEDVKIIVNANSNFTLVSVSNPTYSKKKLLAFRIVNIVFRVLGLKKRFKKEDIYDVIVRKHDIDIIHTPFQSLVKKPNVKSITTLHDVQELHFPEFFTSAQRAYRAVNYKRAIDGADAVIVSYKHVKQDIVNYFEKPENEVFTVLLDMKDLWFDKIVIRDTGLLDAYLLPDKFLLYPAATWAHKNHLRLLEAMKCLDDPEIYLVCTGHQNDHYVKNILPYLESEKLSKQVKFLGIVSDEVLFELYHKCRAVVIPTLYEAGSFPLMESILMGIPVVCSNVTSLPETIGDESFVFNPKDIVDIADKINKIWFDLNYRKENIALLNVQAEKISNNNAASKISKVYEAISK
ncbi:glycosyltransferase family 4 protein [Aequorivita vladivostokensis]|uniref:glycosyltransferase family 4 protein n=1 Tax=Aequorivita vladivostokensis TaxID=171194 RepID=UPI000697B993|nr:glycosyltransferase family 1 protein [Aequorivita vladivostokensis]